jgi:hypothetical protein
MVIQRTKKGGDDHIGGASNKDGGFAKNQRLRI